MAQFGKLGLAVIAVAILALCGPSSGAAPGVVLDEFINEANTPTKSCHASTIAQTPQGLIAAWFGGTAEGKPDVTIWVSLRRDGKWQPAVQVAEGVQPDGKRFPCWNPVLFQYPDGPLVLFYKAGPNPRQWWGMSISSTDGGKTWSALVKLPEGILGPIKDKPVLLADGTLLCPSSTEDAGWRVHIERTADRGKTWSATGPLNDPAQFNLIQPTILDHGSGKLQMLCRSKERRIVESWSVDNGKSWGQFSATALPNPNSGIDAVQLRDGRSLLIYNDSSKARTPLNVAISADGKTWKACPPLETEPGEYSYPAAIQTSDGLVHVTYTWKRQRIKHVVIDPTKLVLTELNAKSR